MEIVRKGAKCGISIGLDTNPCAGDEYSSSNVSSTGDNSVIRSDSRLGNTNRSSGNTSRSDATTNINRSDTASNINRSSTIGAGNTSVNTLLRGYSGINNSMTRASSNINRSSDNSMQRNSVSPSPQRDSIMFSCDTGLVRIITSQSSSKAGNALDKPPFLSPIRTNQPQVSERALLPQPITFKEGDVVGCCVDMSRCEVCFTLNGAVLGVAASNVRMLDYHAAVVLYDEEAVSVSVNMGAQPFVYKPCNGLPAYSSVPPVMREVYVRERRRRSSGGDSGRGAVGDGASEERERAQSQTEQRARLTKSPSLRIVREEEGSRGTEGAGVGASVSVDDIDIQIGMRLSKQKGGATLVAQSAEPFMPYLDMVG